jgi:hypothetical protein
LCKNTLLQSIKPSHLKSSLMAVFWAIASSSLVPDYQRFRSTCCFRYETASISTHTHCHEDPKSCCLPTLLCQNLVQSPDPFSSFSPFCSALVAVVQVSFCTKPARSMHITSTQYKLWHMSSSTIAKLLEKDQALRPCYLSCSSLSHSHPNDCRYF